MAVKIPKAFSQLTTSAARIKNNRNEWSPAPTSPLVPQTGMMQLPPGQLQPAATGENVRLPTPAVAPTTKPFRELTKANTRDEALASGPGVRVGGVVTQTAKEMVPEDMTAKREADRLAAEQKIKAEEKRRADEFQAGQQKTLNDAAMASKGESEASKASISKAQGIVDAASPGPSLYDKLQNDAQVPVGTGTIQLGNVNPDTTDVYGGVAIYFNNGKGGSAKFNAMSPDTYTSEFKAALQQSGITPEAFAYSWANKWMNEHRPGLDPDTRAKEMAIVMYGPKLNLAVDDDDGIVDLDGNPDVGQAAMALSADPVNGPDGPMKDLAKSVQKIKYYDGTGEAPVDQGALDEGKRKAAVDEAKFSMNESMSRLQNMPKLNADDAIRESRQTFEMQQARNLRVTMNRMARSGSSPEAIQGLTLQIAQESEQQQQQLEAMQRLEIDMKNDQNTRTAIAMELQVMNDMWKTLTGYEEQRDAREYMAALQQQQQAIDAAIAARQNDTQWGAVIGGGLLSLGGAALGNFTGQMGGQLGKSLFNTKPQGLTQQAPQAASPMGAKLPQPGVPQMLPATGYDPTSNIG